MHTKQGVVKSSGERGADSLQLVSAGSPASVPLKVSYHASWRLDRDRGTLSDSQIKVGAAPIAVDGRFDSRGDGMHLPMRLHGKNLPVDDLVGLLPAFGVVLPKGSRLSGGTLGMDLKATGPLGALRIAGPVTLDDSRLAGFSLGKNLGTALSLAGIKAPADSIIKHPEMALAVPSATRPSSSIRQQWPASLTRASRHYATTIPRRRPMPIRPPPAALRKRRPNKKSPDVEDVLGSLLLNALKPKSHDKPDKSDGKN